MRRAFRKFPVEKKTLAKTFSGGAGVLQVGVFWDLDNMPPKSVSPYEAAVRLRLAASAIGPVRVAVAYGRQAHAALFFSSDTGDGAHACRFCGRNFFGARSKLLNHFKIHEREHAKRLSRLDSAAGGRYVRLKAQLSLKMDRYRRAARDLLMPSPDALQRAGISVRIAAAAKEALREHMAQSIGRVGCLMVVSNDAGFCGVMEEARGRGLRTVVVCDEGDGPLKRCAHASFSWKDVLSGKARKAAPSTLLKWNDSLLLNKLHWRYLPTSHPSGSSSSSSSSS